MRISYRNRPELKKYPELKKRIISHSVLGKVFESQDTLLNQGQLDLEEGYEYRGVFLFNNGVTYVYDLSLYFCAYSCYKNGEITKQFKGSKYERRTQEVLDTIGFLMMVATFIEYAKIETKYLKPKKKEKLFGCKYKNETDSDIEIIDSTWFTNLVKSDAFKVRGHFRLQPKKKDGKWTKELIWINDFEKKGYTAKARKTKITE